MVNRKLADIIKGQKLVALAERDTVQQACRRMWECRTELFAWLQEGAHLYVCGDEKAMAKDVHTTLAAIVADRSGRSPADAEAYLTDLKQQRRYQRDVY